MDITTTQYQAHNQFTNIAVAGNVHSQGANAIEFYNQGGKTVVINNARKVPPKTSFVISQVFPNVVDNTDYFVNFVTDADSTGTAQLCIVTITKISKF